MKVTTAVIATAGFGSRMLPVTAAVQKELLPILDRPIIDYVVGDCLAAGITRVIFVISPNSHGLQDYYVGNPVLESHLKRYGKSDALKKLNAIHQSATYSFIEQPDDAGYGTGVPLRIAAPHLPKNEAFIYCSGDAFAYREDGVSEMKLMVDEFNDTGAAGAVTGLWKPDNELHRYGVLDLESRHGHQYLRGIVEKPEPGKEPSNIINSTFFVMTPQLLPFVEALKLDPTHNEYLATDVMTAAAEKRDIVVHEAKGRWLDAGNLGGWLEANLVMAQTKPELSHLSVYKP